MTAMLFQKRNKVRSVNNFVKPGSNFVTICDQNYSTLISPLNFFSRVSLLEEVRGTKYVHNIFREDKKEAF